MTDYNELVDALRCELHYTSCPETNCKYICNDTFCDTYRLMIDAAAAIEELENALADECKECDYLVNENARLTTENEALQAENPIVETVLLDKMRQQMEETACHCNVKENAELIAKILDDDVDRKAFEMPKRGEWVYHPKDAIEMMFTLPKCSICGHESSDALNYCPNCGSHMVGENDERN